MKNDQRVGWTGKKWVGLGLAWGSVTLLALPLMAADPEPGVAVTEATRQEVPKADAPKPEVLYREGLEAIKVNDLVASVGLFRGAAVAGHVPSMVKLADALDRSGENQEAMQWYEKAARLDSPEGALGLGQMLISGGYGKERIKEGVTWIRKAADQRFGAAMVILSGVIASDRFVEQPDPKEGFKLLNDAAEMGYLPAMKELIKVYSTGALGQKVDPVQVRMLEGKIQKALKDAGGKP
ncbi:MAG: sel1 repeat family protein [Magnetococcales bacterium]|nr:sel1 repeat family protein [Magnetococcales bacterium]